MTLRISSHTLWVTGDKEFGWFISEFVEGSKIFALWENSEFSDLGHTECYIFPEKYSKLRFFYTKRVAKMFRIIFSLEKNIETLGVSQNTK